VAALGPVEDTVGRQALEGVEVGAGAEVGIDRAADHQHAHLGIGKRCFDAVVRLIDHLPAEGIDRRAVEVEPADGPDRGEADEGIIPCHGRSL